MSAGEGLRPLPAPLDLPVGPAEVAPALRPVTLLRQRDGKIGNDLARTGGFWLAPHAVDQLSLFSALEFIPGTPEARDVRFLLPSEIADAYGPPQVVDLRGAEAMTSAWGRLGPAERMLGVMSGTLTDVHHWLGRSWAPSGQELDRVWAMLNRIAHLAIQRYERLADGRWELRTTRIVGDASFFGERGRPGRGRRAESFWIQWSRTYFDALLRMNWTYALDRHAVAEADDATVRLYFFLAAQPQERGTARGPGHFSRFRFPLGATLYANLGIRDRPDRARKLIARSGESLRALEPIYRSVEVRELRGRRWELVVERENVPSRAEEARLARAGRQAPSAGPLLPSSADPPGESGRRAGRDEPAPPARAQPETPPPEEPWMREGKAMIWAALGLSTDPRLDPALRPAVSAFVSAVGVWMGARGGGERPLPDPAIAAAVERRVAARLAARAREDGEPGD